MATMTTSHLMQYVSHISHNSQYSALRVHSSDSWFTMRVQYWWTLEAENAHGLVHGDVPPLDPLSLAFVLLEQSAQSLGIQMEQFFENMLPCLICNTSCLKCIPLLQWFQSRLTCWLHLLQTLWIVYWYTVMAWFSFTRSYFHIKCLLLSIST